MRIIMLQPPVWGINEPPIAIAQLSACLKKANHWVKSLDLNCHLYNHRLHKYDTAWAIERSTFWASKKDISQFYCDNSVVITDFITDVLKEDPDVLCISANVLSLEFIYLFLTELRSYNRKVKVIMGGANFLIPFDPNPILATGLIDYIIYGEGENTVVELMDRLQSNDKNIESCRGIVFVKNKQTIKTEPREMMVDLNSLPFPDYKDMFTNKNNRSDYKGQHLCFSMSRGCVGKCVYCGPRGYWPGYRSVSGRRMYEEIKHQLALYNNIPSIEFIDLLLNGNMKYLEEFCDLMIAGPLRQNLTWRANMVIRKEMTMEICKKLALAGCRHIAFGNETGSQRLLGLMNKRYSISDADQVLKNVHEAGIEVRCNFMFGFPGETEDDFKQTLDFILRNRNYIDVAYPSSTFCTLEPHSFLSSHFEEFNIVPNIYHGQFWESKDGTNTYIVRMNRYDEFCKFAMANGINVDRQLITSFEHDRTFNLGNYYFMKGEERNAIYWFEKYLKIDPENAEVRNKLSKLKL